MRKAIKVLLVLDILFLVVLMVGNSAPLEAFVGWSVLNTIIIIPAMLIKYAITYSRRRRQKQIALIRNSPPHNSEIKQGGAHGAPIKIPRSESSIERTLPPKPTSLPSKTDLLPSKQQKKVAETIKGLLSNGFLLEASKNRYKALRKSEFYSSDATNKKQLLPGVCALAIDDNVLWKKEFGRPISIALSDAGSMAIVWEKFRIIGPTHSTSTPIVTMVDKDGVYLFEKELPSPAYGCTLDHTLLVLATAFPDNTIYCFDTSSKDLKWKLENPTLDAITKLEIVDDQIFVFDPIDDSKIRYILDASGRLVDDVGHYFKVKSLLERLTQALQNKANVRNSWVTIRDFPMPMVSVMMLDGLPDQLDINVWSHSKVSKEKVTSIVFDVLNELKDLMLIEGTNDITNEEQGVLDPTTWRNLPDSKPVFRKLIKVKLLREKNVV